MSIILIKDFKFQPLFYNKKNIIYALFFILYYPKNRSSYKIEIESHKIILEQCNQSSKTIVISLLEQNINFS